MIQRKPLLTFLSIIFASQIVCVSVYMYTLKKWNYTLHDDLELLKGKLKQLKCTRYYLKKH